MRFSLTGLAAVFAALLLVASGLVLWRLSAAAALQPYEFNLVRWEFEHFPNKWLYLLGRAIRHDRLTPAEEDASIVRYFQLNAEIRDLERQLAQQERDRGSLDRVDPALRQQLERRTRERRSIQNDVEAAMERRLTAVLNDEGLALTLWFLPGQPRLVWPPVDITFAQPSRLLVTSPRDRIVLLNSSFVRSDLSLDQVFALEEQTEAAQPNLSALVISVGGYATYPAVIPEGRDYATSIDTIAHEWTHHYLAFRPLGQRYFSSRDLTTINETVADISGRDLAGLLQSRFPVDLPPAASPPAASTQPDIDKELRELRIAVEGLLQQGRVKEAEERMEETRRQLAAQGVFIRKINQAYFAFHGLYGDSALSISPIGPKVQTVRSLTGSVGDFLRTVSGVTSVDSLDRLIGLLEARHAPAVPAAR
jgi:hypothetical protein